MTEELYNRWQQRLSPFDGVTIAMREPVVVSAFQPLLASIVTFLEHRFGKEQLYFVYDWHEHDGVKIEGTAVEWSALRYEVSFAQELITIFDGADTYVRHAYYTETGNWYLRYIVHEHYSAVTKELTVEFDLTCSAAIAEEFLRNRGSIPCGELYVVSPDEYFNARQAK